MSSRPGPRLLAAALLGSMVACGGGGGGDDGPLPPPPPPPPPPHDVPGHRPSAEQATKLAGIGDSMMQGMDVTTLGDQVAYSFAQGTNYTVFSLNSRYALVSGLPAGEEFESRSGDTMVRDGLRQALLVCAQDPKPDRIVILLGANDACDLTTPETYGANVQAVLGQLASATACGLPTGTRVHVLSVPRVDGLYQVYLQKKNQCPFDGPMAACPRVLGTDQDRQDLATTVNGYNDAIAEAVQAANDAFHHQDGDISFSTDWTDATANSSVGTFAFALDDISDVDCFHPSAQGQRKLACLAWETWEGLGNLAGCL